MPRPERAAQGRDELADAEAEAKWLHAEVANAESKRDDLERRLEAARVVVMERRQLAAAADERVVALRRGRLALGATPTSFSVGSVGLAGALASNAAPAASSADLPRALSPALVAAAPAASSAGPPSSLQVEAVPALFAAPVAARGDREPALKGEGYCPRCEQEGRQWKRKRDSASDGTPYWTLLCGTCNRKGHCPWGDRCPKLRF